MRKERCGGRFLLQQAKISILLSFIFFLATSGLAQMKEISADQLISEASLLLEAGRSEEAVPYLKEYLERVVGSEDGRVLSMAQDVRFKLGAVMLQQNNPAEVARYFQEYTTLRPALQWRDAMKYLSTALLELNRFDECLSVTTNALAGPPPDVRAEIDEEARIVAASAEVSKDPSGYEFDEYGEVIHKGADAADVTKPDEHPSGYSVDDLLILNMTLGEVYSKLGQMTQSIDPFSYVIQNTKNPVHKGYAIMQVVNGLIEKGEFTRLTAWIPQLYRTDARYDIRVNLALMKAANALFEAGEYNGALPLYRMILPRNELIKHLSVKIREMRIAAGLQAPDEPIGDGKLKTESTIFGKRYTTEEFWVEDESAKNANKPKELIEMEDLVKTLESLPPYENEVLYRSAHLYDEVKRPWEAARFFDRVWTADPESELGERSFYDMIRLLLDPLGQVEEAEPRAIAYLDKNREGLVPRQIAYLLTGSYQQNDRAGDVKKLLPYLEGFLASDDSLIRKYECELWYMQAVADMALLNYESAEAGFVKVMTDFPGSHQQENTTYWHAVAVLFQERYEDALAELKAYLTAYPSGAWLDSAAFQQGVCLFSLERYDEAVVQFTAVIDSYPDSRAFPDACNLRGDIYGSQGKLDEAVSDYERAIAAAQTHAQERYAVFQMASVFESEDRFDEILRVVNDYLDRRGAEADIATGIYWIGKTKVNQGRIDDAVQTYVGAVLDYGNDVMQSGVDSIIAELVSLAKIRLNDEARAQLKKELVDARKRADSLTLQLRLRAAVAQIDRQEVELGRQLIQELADLEPASPPVLDAICKASFEMQDYSRAEEILRMFTTKFDDSEYMRSAYKLRGSELFKAGEDEKALKLVTDAQARYGTDYDVAWAQLMKAKILTRQGDYVGAGKTLTDVFNVTGWRGESYAEAAYLLGLNAETASEFLKAHGWYQRTYVQYKGYDNGYWAAESYLGSARCLKKLGLQNDAHNTYRAMLFDKYVNSLPQAEEAAKAVSAEERAEIKGWIDAGIKTNITVQVDAEEGQ